MNIDQPTVSAFVRACQLPREVQFRRFVAHADGRLDCDEVPVQHAVNYIHNTCYLESRNELKSSGEAVWRFNQLVRHYQRWREQQEMHA